ncbi:FAST kinase domain-containing protein 5, mitochondrial [Lepisosteus oculatus]|uniref:FAST kinase domain-containing protein 5, mitochondrial n=1 Tax=Lepisosteus oculatus TaxID=7918 RepID=UPI00371C679A
MAWYVLCRRLAVPRRPRLPVVLWTREDGDTGPGQRRRKSAPREQEEEDEEEEEGELVGRPSAWLEYRVPYCPSAYHLPSPGRAPSPAAGEPAEEPDPQGAWQGGNPYSVSCSRRLSSSQNTLLDLAFSPARAGLGPQQSAPARAPELDYDSLEDPRAFQSSRPEYRQLCHDLAERPPPLAAQRAFLLLHRVAVLKGGLQPDGVAALLAELGRLPPELQAPVRGDPRFSMLCRLAAESLPRFSDAQLLDVLRAFVRLGLPPGHSMLALYEAECRRRACQLRRADLLLAADLWRCLGRSVPQFLEQVCSRVGHCLPELGSHELVQLLYLIGEGRRAPADLLPRLEGALLRCAEQLGPEEVGAVSLGLFKSQSALSQGAVCRLADRALELLPDMSNAALVSVLKLLRFSHLYHKGLLSALAAEVPRRAPALGAPALMHVALACSSLRFVDERVLEAVAAEVPALAPHCRSKDAAKLLWAFCSLGYQPSNAPAFLCSLTQQLRARAPEFERYPEHLLTGLLALAFVGRFPRDLLGLALSPRLVRRAAEVPHLELLNDLLTLDGTVGLELPDWDGPRLPAELRQEAVRRLWDFAQKNQLQRPELREAEALMGELLQGAHFVRRRMILPHTRSVDLEVHLDPAGRPAPLGTPLPQDPSGGRPLPRGWEEDSAGVPITDGLLAQLLDTSPTGAQERQAPDLADGTLGFPTGAPPPPPPGAPCKLAVQVSSRNHYCYSSRLLLGLHAMKRRQLALAGYRAVELPPWEWLPLLRRSRTEKLAYLHCKVFGAPE